MFNKKRIVAIIVALAILGIGIGVWIATHQSWVGEQSDHADYVHKTIGLITDLPHSTVEIFWSLVENVATFAILWTIGKRRLHRQIDAEHGFEHDEHGDVHKIDPS